MDALLGIREDRRNPLPDDKRYAEVWSVDDPFKTPSGLADKARAAESFTWAVAETKQRFGSSDVSWGEVHRVRRGKVDVPVGGCGNDLGCFRILSFARDTDGKVTANSGDGWVFAVEFGDTPRAYSVLSYGQSRLPASPWHADQAEMFAKGEMKKVAFTEKDITLNPCCDSVPGNNERGEFAFKIFELSKRSHSSNVLTQNREISERETLGAFYYVRYLPWVSSRRTNIRR